MSVRICLIGIALLFLFAGTAACDVILVPDAVRTINAAIDAASSGDFISVRPNPTGDGHYHETVTLKPGVTLQPRPGYDTPVIEAVVDSTAQTYAVIATGTFETNATIEGFRIIGFTDIGIVLGASMTTGSIFVKNCTIEGGDTGILVDPGLTANVQNCRITNSATGITVVGLAEQPHTILVENNEITGAAIGIDIEAPDGHPLVRNNTLYDNTVGIEVYSCDPETEIRQNLVVDSSTWGFKGHGNSFTILYNDAYNNGSYPHNYNYDDCGSSYPNLPASNSAEPPGFCSLKFPGLDVDSFCAAHINPYNLQIVRNHLHRWHSRALRHTEHGQRSG